MKLVVGLGNPGSKYAETRHNIGFEVLDVLANKLFAGSRKQKFEAEYTEVGTSDDKLILLWPQTFMNLSGSSVVQMARFYQVDPKDTLIVCDDFNLPLERLRFRPQGSAGGQNGLKDIINKLGTNEFPRLRFGVGPVPPRWNPADFVLGKFTKKESEFVGPVVHRAAEAILRWREAGIDTCMNEFNATSN